MLENCEPKDVFYFFEEITKIPHGSGDEKRISDWLVDFAKDRNLWYKQDEAHNVIIKKPGTPGYENSKPIIIQGHTDMVCEKNNITIHDFTKDPLKLKIVGDFVQTEGTTLGADNGIAVAMALAILDSHTISHPPLEILMTSAEEIGLLGAAALDADCLEGKALINLDSEDEGHFCSSCAGGMRATIHLPTKTMELDDSYVFCKLEIRGLKGGHSGGDIHLERGNSNRLMGRLLNTLNNSFDMYMGKISGGSKDNAIPRESEAIIAVKEKELEAVVAEVKKILLESFAHEYRISDPDVDVVVGPSEAASVFPKEISKKIISALMLIPLGIQARSLEIEDLVETSNNIGVVDTFDHEVAITSALRSSVITRKYYMLDQLQLICDLIGGTLTTTGDYPAWEFNSDSQLRAVFSELYTKIYNEEPKISATHGGLECGVFYKKIENLDMISFGPDIFGAHTPDEKMSISSTKRVWEFLLKGLELLK